MKLLSLMARIIVIATVWLVLTSAGLASALAPWVPLPAVSDGHRSSLRARITTLDGTTTTVTIQGVGCTDNICSRVRARAFMADSVWLDGLAGVSQISHEPRGRVNAVFTFKDGTERHASVVEENRVLYVDGRYGRIKKLDLGNLSQIEFQ